MWRFSRNYPSFSAICRLRTAPDRYFSSAFPADGKVLVANRGEIACRVFRTCQRLGIPTVAVFSSADKNALHVRMASEAYQIGSGPTPRESYLLRDRLFEVCLESGANYIHPGYGFLSEDAKFCRLLEQENLNWIGPPASAMESMASKSKAKSIMEDANVPTTPGYLDPEGLPERQSVDFLLEKAHEIGFPVLIKAVLGGGGKGMRLVQTPGDFASSLQACQAEASAAFGNGDVLLEKFLVNPRHIEVQIMADKQGNVRHLLERDCSLQRRHQKVIEEAPASDLPNELRHKLQESARKAAAAVGYVNAGTVEFLLDPATNEYYFCEMNTRLQVEHPVTEQVTGVDLVEWQLRVAAGEKLPDNMVDNAYGHSMEARIYAENPARGFIPSTGLIWNHEPPVGSNEGLKEGGVRVDTGLDNSQQKISIYYDPMISKLIVHGKDREEARQRLVKALKNYKVAGEVDTNIDFLIACAEHPAMVIHGGIDTGFLDRHGDEIVEQLRAETPPRGRAIGAFIASLMLEDRWSNDEGSSGPWSSDKGSWRLGGAEQRPERIFRPLGAQVNDTKLDGDICCRCNADGSFDIQAGNGENLHIAGKVVGQDLVEVIVNGKERVQLVALVQEINDVFYVRMWPRHQPEHRWSVDLLHPMHPSLQSNGEQDSPGTNPQAQIVAPMPGRITKVMTKVGDRVDKDDTLVVMEAMKMEHSVVAPFSGSVSQVTCEVDDVVDDGVTLIKIGDEVN